MRSLAVPTKGRYTYPMSNNFIHTHLEKHVQECSQQISHKKKKGYQTIHIKMVPLWYCHTMACHTAKKMNKPDMCNHKDESHKCVNLKKTALG